MREEHKLPIDLHSGLNGHRSVVPLVNVGHNPRAEDARTDPRAVEERHAELAEPKRRKVPLEHPPCERCSSDTVDLKTGKAIVLSVPFDLSVVDHVVSESAEVEA